MADNLNQSMNELNETLKMGVIPPLMQSIEELTRVTLRTGRDYGEGFRGLTEQFRGMDVALSDVKDLLGESIRTGVAFEGTNKQLLVDIKRLGFNVTRFTDMMGTFEQVLGFNESTTGHLADRIIDFSIKFGRSAEQLASTMATLVEPMARMCNAFGGTAAAGFAESVIGLGAAMGPKIADQIGPVMSKFITADPEGFRRAALGGGGLGAMDSPQAMIAMAQGVISRIDRLVTPGAPFTAGIAAQMFGLTQQDVNILRQLGQANVSQIQAAEENMRAQAAMSLMSETFTGSLNSIILDLQAGLLPVWDALNDSISVIFKVFKEIFPSFSDTAIKWGEALGMLVRDVFSEDNIRSAFGSLMEWGRTGITIFKDLKTIITEWATYVMDSWDSWLDRSLALITNVSVWAMGKANTGWDWLQGKWNTFTASLETLMDSMTRVFAEFEVRLNAMQMASAAGGGVLGSDGIIAALAGGGDFRGDAEAFGTANTNLSPAQFQQAPGDIARAQRDAGNMFADPDLAAAQEALVAAMETNAGATAANALQLKRANDRQSRHVWSAAEEYMEENRPAGARRF